mgnify:CR=1 FL=1
MVGSELKGVGLAACPFRTREIGTRGSDPGFRFTSPHQQCYKSRLWGSIWDHKWCFPREWCHVEVCRQDGKCLLGRGDQSYRRGFLIMGCLSRFLDHRPKVNVRNQGVVLFPDFRVLQTWIAYSLLFQTLAVLGTVIARHPRIVCEAVVDPGILARVNLDPFNLRS